MKESKTYDDVRRSVRTMRLLQEEAGKETDMNGVPYSKEDMLYQYSVDSAVSQFGADFSKIENPLIYYQADGDVTLSGLLGGIEGAKFQFRYNEQDGCYIWFESVHLNNGVLDRLRTINGFYLNWRQKITENKADYMPMSLANQK